MPKTIQNVLWWLGVLVLRAASPLANVMRWVGRGIAGVITRRCGAMTRNERVMLDRFREDLEPECLFRTKSRMDVGQWCNPWWGGAPLWLAVVGDRLMVFAYGKKPHLEQFALANLGASQYNAVMSELVLASNENAELRTLRMPPLEGRQVLDRVRQEEASE
ncbi:MAG: hypothetical protein HRT89_17315 [Lentisphaeria bacterium]|nr:hypothetical protein [Lentisphaeria bacterium]NQZ69818.1 hypothetical protein [Lentisphaeria bacterium]